jgi:O-antigen ligase
MALAAPLSSFFTRADVALAERVFVGVLWLCAAAAPAAAAYLVVALLPLALLVASQFAGLTATQLVEASVLAMASGGSLRRVWPTGRERGGWLGAPALLVGAAVVASVVDSLAEVRAIAPARPFFTELWQYGIGDYWGESTVGWPVLHSGFRWVSALILAVHAEAIIRGAPGGAARVVRWWAVAVAAAALFTLRRIAEVVGRHELSSMDALQWLLGPYRLSALHPDPNAAGSLFGLLLTVAVIVALRRRSIVFAATTIPLLALGFFMAKSRAAVGSVVLVGALRWLTSGIGGRRRLIGTAVVIGLAVTAVAIWMTTSRAHVSAGQALELRWQMASVGVHMIGRYPLTGVGLGDYARTSRRFADPEHVALANFAPGGENAHNNYLQIAGEMGLPALAAFLWLVGAPIRAACKSGRIAAVPERDALVTGLGAFLVSALFGHPLLVPEVFVLFLTALALLAGLEEQPPRRTRWSAGLPWAGVGCYTASLVWRL